MCAIYSLRIILLVNNIRVRNFRRFGWNENFLTTKNSRITVLYLTMSSLPATAGVSTFEMGKQLLKHYNHDKSIEWFCAAAEV